MPRTVVVPIPRPGQDPEGVALAAVPSARTLAARTGAKVVLVIAVDVMPAFDPLSRSLALPSSAVQDQLLAEARTALDEIGAQFPGHQVETVVRWGNPVDVVLAVLAAAEDPILVLASRGRQGVRRLLQGSVAFRLVHEATCPALVVHGPLPEAAASTTPALTTVLVPLDRSPFAEHALGAALAALDGSDVRVHLVHVIEPFDYPEIAAYELVDVARPIAQAYLDRVAERLMGDGYRVTVEVRAGKPAAQIAETAAEQGVDLIAMATHGRGGFTRFVFGSTAERLLQSARVPLLLVRPDEADVEASQRQTTLEAIARRRALEASPPAIWSRRAGEIMTTPVVVAREESSLAEIVETMLAKRIGCVPVVDRAGHLTGIITESDFVGADRCVPLAAYQVPQCFREWLTDAEMQRLYAAGRETTAGQFMRHPVIAVAEDEPVSAVVAKLVGRNIKRVPVVRDGIPVGVIARHDVLKLLLPDQR